MNKFENIVIATDLDGTFLDEHEGLVARNLEAIEYFKENGGYFTVATGRASEHVLGAVPNVDKLINIPAVICNGACLYDFRTGNTTFMRCMEYSDVVSIVGFIRENFPSAGVRASSPEYCFICPPEDIEKPLIVRDLERYSQSKTLIVPVEDWCELPIMKVVVRIDADILPKAMAALKAHFGDKFSPTQSWSTIIDIQPGGINKGLTLERYVRATLGKSAKIYACGDYINDTEMLMAADVAVCPSNAHESIKNLSDLCLCSNNEGLIADLVEYIEKHLN